MPKFYSENGVFEDATGGGYTEVENEAGRNALTPVVGDECYQRDVATVFKYVNDGTSEIWIGQIDIDADQASHIDIGPKRIVFGKFLSINDDDEAITFPVPFASNTVPVLTMTLEIPLVLDGSAKTDSPTQ